jgi:hypothetical protein
MHTRYGGERSEIEDEDQGGHGRDDTGHRVDAGEGHGVAQQHGRQE